MNISLTPELEAFVQQKVESGLYRSASEVVREGLRLLKERDILVQIKLEELRQELRAGLDSGPAQPLDIADVIQRGKTRHTHQSKSQYENTDHQPD